ncbi:hypothetical protein POUND7_014936 [Theobroma cacao]
MAGTGFLGIVLLGLLAIIGSTHAQLQMDFYAKSCPKAEKIVKDYVNKHIPNAPSLAASFIRMHFHDCFVRGGPFWNVPTGRRDGVISNVSEANANIPSPFSNFTTLLRLFNNQGLDSKDLVLLSGAHTIGLSHCPAFSRRLYNSSGPGGVDPTLDSEYASNLKANKCRNPNDNTTKVEMDPGSRNTFDLSYYTLLTKRRGLFNSDAALTTNSTSLALINQLLSNPLKFFYAEFAKSMEKMGRINVKTGSEGEIRKQCAFVNS